MATHAGFVSVIVVIAKDASFLIVVTAKDASFVISFTPTVRCATMPQTTLIKKGAISQSMNW